MKATTRKNVAPVTALTQGGSVHMQTVFRQWSRLLLSVLVIGGVFVAGMASAQEAVEANIEAIAAARSVSGLISRFDGVEISGFADSPCTSSTAFADMPGMAKAFTLGGTTREEVVVMFQAEWLNAGGDARLRLTIDNAVQPGAGSNPDEEFRPNTTHVSTNGYNFMSSPLTPGVRVAEIQWRSANGLPICVNERSLIVLAQVREAGGSWGLCAPRAARRLWIGCA